VRLGRKHSRVVPAALHNLICQLLDEPGARVAISAAAALTIFQTTNKSLADCALKFVEDSGDFTVERDGRGSRIFARRVMAPVQAMACGRDLAIALGLDPARIYPTFAGDATSLEMQGGQKQKQVRDLPGTLGRSSAENKPTSLETQGGQTTDLPGNTGRSNQQPPWKCREVERAPIRERARTHAHARSKPLDDTQDESTEAAAARASTNSNQELDEVKSPLPVTAGCAADTGDEQRHKDSSDLVMKEDRAEVEIAELVPVETTGRDLVVVPTGQLIGLEGDAEVSDADAAKMLARLGVATDDPLIEFKREAVVDAIGKARDQWEALEPNARGRRHGKYATFAAWFRSEWVHRLRTSLRAMTADDVAQSAQENDRDLKQIFRSHRLGHIGGKGGMTVDGQLVKTACTRHPIPGLTANDVTENVAAFVKQFEDMQPTDVVGTLRLWIVDTVVKRLHGPLADQVQDPVDSGSAAWALPGALVGELLADYKLVPDEARRARGEFCAFSETDRGESKNPEAYRRQQAATMVKLACSVVSNELPTDDPEWLLAHYGRDLQAIAEARVREVFGALVEYGRNSNKPADKIKDEAGPYTAAFFRRVAGELGHGTAKGPARPPKRKPGFN